MSDDIGILGEGDEANAVTVSIGHLYTIPKGIIVVSAIVNARFERHAIVIDRIAKVSRPIVCPSRESEVMGRINGKITCINLI
jgi:hypothetical protein